MLHDHDSFLKHLGDHIARSVGAILATLPQLAALRERASYSVKLASPRDVPHPPALRRELA